MNCANDLRKRFKFLNLLCSKVLVFKFLIKFYIEQLLISTCFGVQIVRIMLITKGTASGLIYLKFEDFFKKIAEGWLVDFLKTLNFLCNFF